MPVLSPLCPYVLGKSVHHSPNVSPCHGLSTPTLSLPKGSSFPLEPTPHEWFFLEVTLNPRMVPAVEAHGVPQSGILVLSSSPMALGQTQALLSAAPGILCHHHSVRARLAHRRLLGTCRECRAAGVRVCSISHSIQRLVGPEGCDASPATGWALVLTFSSSKRCLFSTTWDVGC